MAPFKETQKPMVQFPPPRLLYSLIGLRLVAKTAPVLNKDKMNNLISRRISITLKAARE